MAYLFFLFFFFLQLPSPGGTGVAMAARDESGECAGLFWLGYRQSGDSSEPQKASQVVISLPGRVRGCSPDNDNYLEQDSS